MAFPSTRRLRISHAAATKYAIEMSRERERERILSEMTRREFGDEAQD